MKIPSPTLLRAVAVGACLPYLALKITWMSGGAIGIPAGSELLNDSDALFLINGLTVVMDCVVILLAFALTSAWGRRLPAWLVALPLWLATGLLAPIAIGFPTDVLVTLLTDGAGEGGSGGGDGGEAALLDGWVFTLVYTGFGIQALALGGLFVRYLGDRWGHLLRGRVGASPAGETAAAQKVAVGGAALLAVLPVAVHLMWACGVETGLPPAHVEVRDAGNAVTDVTDALFAVAAVLGAALLVLRFRPAVRVRTALALGWTGSAAVTAWGGWLMLAGLVNSTAVDAGAKSTGLMALTYAVQMLVGVLILSAGAHYLAARAHASASARAERGADAERCVHAA